MQENTKVRLGSVLESPRRWLQSSIWFSLHPRSGFGWPRLQLLSEMLSSFEPSMGRVQDDDVIKVRVKPQQRMRPCRDGGARLQQLYSSCLEARPRLIRMAAEVKEADNILGASLGKGVRTGGRQLPRGSADSAGLTTVRGFCGYRGGAGGGR